MLHPCHLIAAHNLCRNSEIYNHEDVQQHYLPGVSMVRDSKSDSAKPGHLYEKYGDDDKIWNALDGTFACVIYDERTQQFCAARDPIGICPMYWGKDANGATWFASEMKALQHQCVSFEIFPPVRAPAQGLRIDNINRTSLMPTVSAYCSSSCWKVLPLQKETEAHPSSASNNMCQWQHVLNIKLVPVSIG